MPLPFRIDGGAAAGVALHPPQPRDLHARRGPVPLLSELALLVVFGTVLMLIAFRTVAARS